MASSLKYRYPPAPNSGDQTFSPDLVGFQLVNGGGLTQANFEFTTSVVEKVNRKFDIGVFSDPFTLDTLNIDNIEQSRAILAKQYSVYPNYDISNVTNFSLYGSLAKRLEVSIIKIINYFPAGLVVDQIYYDYTTANTATNISFDVVENETTFDIDVTRIKNPFDIDYSTNADRNLSVRPFEFSPLRNFTREYLKYALFISGDYETEFKIIDFTPSSSLSAGTIQIVVEGNPFSGSSSTNLPIVLRPNLFETEVAFDEPFDEVEKFLLNRMVTPRYTAYFKYPRENDNGQTYIANQTVTWPLDGTWNLDIRTRAFDSYLEQINEVAVALDSFKTNLISRFLITGSFKEFDTEDQRVEKVIQIYGRAYDETKKFIDALAYITSVNYVPKDDIPSQLLVNLAYTLGYQVNISPITNDDFLTSVFGTKNQSIYPGMTRDLTPSELNYEYYRKLIINSGWLFRSKGTRKSVEFIMRMVGAPQALVEFNETIYLADSKINMTQFTEQFVQLTGGTYSQVVPILDPEDTYKIQGVTYTGFTIDYEIEDVNFERENYPVDAQGYPRAPFNGDDYFFEKGSGWFEQTPKHRAEQDTIVTQSTFTGQNPNVQTVLQPYTYGQKYFDRFRSFPYMTLGFDLTQTIDDKKSWTDDEIGLRKTQGGFNAYYAVSNEKLVLNAKNVDLFMNMGQGLEYDVWDMSRKYNYPISASGLTTGQGGIDNTVIQPNPKQKTFFEFAQTFWKNMINVRNRQTINDGKGGGYPTLQQIYWNYLQSDQTVNIPSNQYTYQKMIDFTLGLGNYWVRLVEQMIPASTLWNTGTRFENSQFHRQKVVWRRQRGCEIVPVPCIPCTLEGQLFGYDCIDQTLQCGIYPWTEPTSETSGTTFQQVLYNQINSLIELSGYTTSECDLNSVTSIWYTDLRLDNDILVQTPFFTGYTATDAPTNQQWIDGLNSNFSDLYVWGLNYSITNGVITVSNTGCMADFTNKTLQLNVGIDITIYCS